MIVDVTRTFVDVTAMNRLWPLCATVRTQPKSYIETTDRRDKSAANCQSRSEDGCYREKFRDFVAWAEPDPKTAFCSRFI